VPALPEFLRTAMAARLKSEDFEQLMEQIRKRKAGRRQK
jgi:hypothetical protein